MENSTTEARNEATMHLDEMTVEEALITMNKEDQQVPLAVRKAIPQLTKVIKKQLHSIKRVDDRSISVQVQVEDWVS